MDRNESHCKLKTADAAVMFAWIIFAVVMLLTTVMFALKVMQPFEKFQDTVEAGVSAGELISMQ